MPEIEYRSCGRCGATTIMVYHWWTGSNIEIDPLPHRDGNIEVNFEAGKCKVIPIKHMKDHPLLWQAHVATCPSLAQR
jgi:hypothetical protein